MVDKVAKFVRRSEVVWKVRRASDPQRNDRI